MRLFFIKKVNLLIFLSCLSFSVKLVAGPEEDKAALKLLLQQANRSAGYRHPLLSSDLRRQLATFLIDKEYKAYLDLFNLLPAETRAEFLNPPTSEDGQAPLVPRVDPANLPPEKYRWLGVSAISTSSSPARDVYHIRSLDFSYASLIDYFTPDNTSVNGYIALALVPETFIDKFRLNGRLSSSIKHLLFLQSLNIESSHLEGIIPKELIRLPNLQDLDLSDNHLKGAIPIFVANRFRKINLSNNELSGAVKGLENLRYLEELNLQGNRISKIDNIAEFARLPNLRKVDLSSNMLSQQQQRLIREAFSNKPQVRLELGNQYLHPKALTAFRKFRDKARELRGVLEQSCPCLTPCDKNIFRRKGLLAGLPFKYCYVSKVGKSLPQACRNFALQPVDKKFIKQAGIAYGRRWWRSCKTN